MAGLVLVALFVALSLAIGSAQKHTVERLRASSKEVKRWGGWILVAIGTWFLALSIWADFFAGIFPV